MRTERSSQIESPSFFSTLAGEITREMFLARTTPDSWLIDLDLTRLIPLMTTRVIVSLKKAADKPQSNLNYGTLSGPSTNAINRYPPRGADDIPLSVLEGERR
jgi:hypothetical protein